MYWFTKCSLKFIKENFKQRANINKLQNNFKNGSTTEFNKSSVVNLKNLLAATNKNINNSLQLRRDWPLWVRVRLSSHWSCLNRRSSSSLRHQSSHQRVSFFACPLRGNLPKITYHTVNKFSARKEWRAKLLARVRRNIFTSFINWYSQNNAFGYGDTGRVRVTSYIE